MSSKSSLSEYRKAVIDDGLKYSELKEYGYDDEKEFLIPESSVVQTLNLIESDLNEIADMLSDIYGLSEIDVVKEKMNELSAKLY